MSWEGEVAAEALLRGSSTAWAPPTCLLRGVVGADHLLLLMRLHAQ